MISSPPFGQADLTNCERELIHLTGSVQPHGVLLVVRAAPMTIARASRSCAELLGVPAAALVERPLAILGQDLDRRIRELAARAPLSEPEAVQCQLEVRGEPRQLEGTVHRNPAGLLLLELELVGGSQRGVETVDLRGPVLVAQVEMAVQRLGQASTIDRLADATVRSFRELTGYDRVMVYKFDPDGHGLIIAEAREPRLETLLGHHYPATDIPQRARELYLRNKLRVLVDVNYTPSPLEPLVGPGAQEDLDLSLAYLRSMSPLHLQYLKNMGVTATLVASLVRDGKLWGLVACHHYSPRNLRLSVKAAADLLAEVTSSRLAAIESYAQTQVAIQVRRLEQRLVEATSTEGDWRMALLRNPRTVLQPLDATGAALFYEGEILTAGEVPSTPELRALMQWVASLEPARDREAATARPGEDPPISRADPDGFYSTSSIARENPRLESLTPTASGVLAVRLSTARPEYLMWFRREQLQTVTWAGDPSKPMLSNDPLELSPRRSFAAWSEIVRGTAVRWSEGELATARAFGAALVDIIVQINAVRLLISEQQLAQVRGVVDHCKEPVVIANPGGTLLFANEAFNQLAGRPASGLAADLFSRPRELEALLGSLASGHRSWRGEQELRRGDGSLLPVAVRAEVVPGRGGGVMGFFLLLEDLTAFKEAEAARVHLEQSLAEAEHGAHSAAGDGSGQPDRLMSALLSNASLAAMDIADGGVGAHASAVPALKELEASTRRAASLYQRLRDFT